MQFSANLSDYGSCKEKFAKNEKQSTQLSVNSIDKWLLKSFVLMESHFSILLDDFKRNQLQDTRLNTVILTLTLNTHL